MVRITKEAITVSITLCMLLSSCSSDMTLDYQIHPNSTYQVTKSTTGLVNSALFTSKSEYEIAVADHSNIIVSVINTESWTKNIEDGTIEEGTNISNLYPDWTNPNYCTSDDKKSIRSDKAKNSNTHVGTAEPIKIWNDQGNLPLHLSSTESSQTITDNGDHSIIRDYLIDSITPQIVYLSYREEVRYHEEGKQLMMNNSFKKTDSGRLEYDRVNEYYSLFHHVSETKGSNQENLEEKSSVTQALSKLYVTGESTIRITKLTSD